MKIKGVQDYHLHSNVSFDGRVPIREMCQEAINRGLLGLTFTEHWELGYQNSRFTFNIEEYKKQIEDARGEFPDFEIGMGIELGLSSFHQEEAQKISQHGWDFIIGSCHNIDGVNVSGGDYGMGKSKKECYGGYLRELCRIIKENPVFDVVGHLDLPRRDANYTNRDLLYKDFSDEIDALFAEIIPLGIGIELNTAGWRYGLDAAQPHISVLKRYRQMGGEIITCGSDRHTFASIGHRLGDAYDILRAAGFKYVSLFKGRKLRQVEL